jgi:hypothetical protein
MLGIGIHTREYTIAQSGITLLPSNENAIKALPLERYISILSLTPTRFPFAAHASGLK